MSVSLNKTVLLLMGALGGASLPLPGAPAPGTQRELSAALLQTQKDATSEFVISFWSTGEGLPVNDIQEIKETPDGYLWLGTHHGLVRFDGARFETFFRTPTGARYGTRVGPMEVDGRGRLWLAPDEVGLVCREAGAFVEVLTNREVLRARAECLCSDGTNHILWVDAEGGLGRISTETPRDAERLGEVASPASRWVSDFSGRLWLVNRRNLRLYEGLKGHGVIVPGRASLVAAPRREGGLWVAREAKLRFVLADGSNRRSRHLPLAGAFARELHAGGSPPAALDWNDVARTILLRRRPAQTGGAGDQQHFLPVGGRPGEPVGRHSRWGIGAAARAALLYAGSAKRLEE